MQSTPNRQTILSDIKRESEGGESVTIAQVKNFLRLDYDVDDTLISILIDSANQAFEAFANRSLFESEITAYYESFGNTIRLPYSPVREVNSVKIQFLDGEEQDVEWELFGDQNLVLKPSNIYGEGYRLIINYSAGYDEIDPRIKLGLLKWIATNYEDRQDTADFNVFEVPNGSRSQWMPFRVMMI